MAIRTMIVLLASHDVEADRVSLALNRRDSPLSERGNGKHQHGINFLEWR